MVSFIFIIFGIMIITMSGRAGSGKSSLAKAIAEKLGYTYIGIWAIKREVAASMWLSILQFDELGNKPENVAEFDLKYEDYQKALSLDDNIVLDARLGFYCQPKSLKIFLDVDPKVAAQRIFDNKRPTDNYSSVQEVLQKTAERSEENKIRYQKLYGVDITDFQNFDVIFDTTHNTLQQNIDQLLEIIKKRLKQ